MLFSHDSREGGIRKMRGGNKECPYGYPRQRVPSTKRHGTKTSAGSHSCFLCFCGRASVVLQPPLKDGVPHEVDATPEIELAHRVGFVDFDSLDA
jgi:hypothetical protein